MLYGLYAVLRLHNAQEEEGAFSLVPNGAANAQAAAGREPPAESGPAEGPRSRLILPLLRESVSCR